MERVFDTILGMSVVGIYIILVVLLVRQVMWKLPRLFSYALWLVVFVRLAIPVMPRTPYSLIPAFLPQLASGQMSGGWNGQNSSDADIVRQTGEVIDGTAEGAAPFAPNDSAEHGDGSRKQFLQDSEGADGKMQGDGAGKTDVRLSPMQGKAGEDASNLPKKTQQAQQGSPSGAAAFWLQIHPFAFRLWFVITLGLMGYHIMTYIRLGKSLKNAAPMQPGVYEIPYGHVSFVYGIYRPRIYLASGLDASVKELILCHEQVHLRRRDYMWKPLALLVCCVHWFHPAVWLAFYLMNQDMEISCDEQVILRMGEQVKQTYSRALLDAARLQDEMGVKQTTVCALLSFGEDRVKTRIRHVLKAHKLPVGFSVAAFAFVIAVSVGLLSAPAEGHPDREKEGGSYGNSMDESGSWPDGISEQDTLNESKHDMTEKNLAIWREKASEYGMAEEEIQKWYQIFAADDVPFDADVYRISDVFLEDMNADGAADVVLTFFVPPYAQDERKAEEPDHILYFYIDQKLAYQKTYSDLTAGSIEQLLTGDVDHDGMDEVIYSMDTGGNGGAGSHSTEILKYLNGKLVPMKLPNDMDKDDHYDGEAEIQVDVRVGTEGMGTDHYEAYCPSLDQSIEFYGKNARAEGREDGELLMPYAKEGETVGGNVRGVFFWELVAKDGRVYLSGREFLSGEGGPSHGIGEAALVFDWDESGKPSVISFDLIPFEDGDMELYESLTAALPPSYAYAYVRLKDLPLPVLLVSDMTYEYEDALYAALVSDVYYAAGDRVQKLGSIESGGTAYPISTDETGIYAGDGHEVRRYTIDEQKYQLVLAEAAGEVYEPVKDGKEGEEAAVTYSYETPEGGVQTVDSNDRLEALSEQFGNARVVSFDVTAKRLGEE